MAHNFPTTADVLKFGDAFPDSPVTSNLLNDAPVIAALPAMGVSGNTYRYRRLTSAPAVGLRAPNAGRDLSHANYESVTIALAILSASFQMDAAVAKADQRGVDVVLGEQAEQHLRAAMFAAEQKLISGVTANDGFDGLAERVKTLANAMMVNAGGTTADTASSVYAIRATPEDVMALWGEDAAIEIADPVLTLDIDDEGKKYEVFNVPISGWFAPKIGGTYSVGRICNLTADAGKGLTDDLLASLVSKFPAGRGPTHLLMSRRSRLQLQQSRVATNATGAAVPTPTEYDGIPIVATDALTNVEALIAS